MPAIAYPDAPGLEELILGKDRDDIGGFATVELISPGPRGPHVTKRMKTWVVSHRHKGHNLVVNSGKVQLWRLAQGNQLNIFDQFRIGTSAQAAASGDTNVLSPVAGTINTADDMTIVGSRSAQWIISYPSGGGSISAANIQEVVILNQNTSPGGSAMMRALFNPLTKTTADKLKITYQARIV